jgi:hypothetical protein
MTEPANQGGFEPYFKKWWATLTDDQRTQLQSAAAASSMDEHTENLLLTTKCPIGPIGTKWEPQPDWDLSWPSTVRTFVLQQPEPKAFTSRTLQWERRGEPPNDELHAWHKRRHFVITQEADGKWLLWHFSMFTDNKDEVEEKLGVFRPASIEDAIELAEGYASQPPF